MTLRFPAIQSATLTPNPVAIRGAVFVSVLVTETEKTLANEVIYAGEVLAGEV